jgi:hypothetical protein
MYFYVFLFFLALAQAFKTPLFGDGRGVQKGCTHLHAGDEDRYWAWDQSYIVRHNLSEAEQG